VGGMSAYHFGRQAVNWSPKGTAGPVEYGFAIPRGRQAAGAPEGWRRKPLRAQAAVTPAWQAGQGLSWRAGRRDEHRFTARGSAQRVASQQTVSRPKCL